MTRFSYSKSMESIDPWGVVKFDPRGMNGTIYICIGAIAIATYQISNLWALWFQRRRVLTILSFKRFKPHSNFIYYLSFHVDTSVVVPFV